MRKVAFAGAYGLRSQGDEAALIVLAEGLRQRIGPFDGVVVTRHARDNPYAQYGLRSVQNIEYNSKSESIGKWFRGFNYSDDRSDLKSLQEEICSSDLLILGAGNWLVDVTIDLLRGPIPYLMVLTLMAKMTETPVMWFGMSIGPFRTEYGRRLSRLSASLADIITVRDDQSVIELRKLGFNGTIMQLPDPVLGLLPPTANGVNAITSGQEAYRRSGPLFVVSVRNMPSHGVLGTGRYTEIMATICDSLVLRYAATLLFVPHCVYQHGNEDEDDRHVARQVVDRMQHAGNTVTVNDDLTVMQCLGLYGQAEIALCTRLHANVYAAIQGVPPVAISYNPKVAGFLHSLGFDDLVVPLPELSPQQVLNKVEKAMDERSRLSSAILARVASARTEVERYVEIACDLIAKKGKNEK